MNARKIWTELFQKPAGRLVLFLLVGAIFLAFILMRRTPQPKPDNTPVPGQATRAKSYSFHEDIEPLSRTEATPSPRETDKIARATPTPKPPPPIPQTIFATREQSVSEWFLPYGRLLRCELVNTVDSTNLDTPIIGLVIEDTMARRARDHPRGHGGSWHSAEVTGSRAHRLRPPMVPGPSGRQGACHFRHGARLRAR